MFILWIIASICFIPTEGLQSIWAVNCGGQGHTDINGVHYQQDPLTTGTASDHGRKFNIKRVPLVDQVLYQTERYHTSSFTYNIPLAGDGNYILVIKLSEVWFWQPNQKVFDVMLNKEHTIIENIDIFSLVGRGVAHEEIIEFRVKSNELIIDEQSSQLTTGNTVPLTFVKGVLDNPKVNAIALYKGSAAHLPRLPPMTPQSSNGAFDDLDEDMALDHFDESARRREEVDEEELEEQEELQTDKRQRPTSGPRLRDPYSEDLVATSVLPVLLAVAAVVPTVFCVCRL